MEMTIDQKVVEVLKKNGYKLIKDNPDFVIMQKGSEQVWVESRDIDLCNPF